MLGKYLEQLGEILSGPIEAVHSAIASEEQKDENGNVDLSTDYLIGGTFVVAIASLYAASKAGLVKPKWVTKIVRRAPRRVASAYTRRRTTSRRRYYRRRK